MCVADAINKAKEFADNVGTTDQLRNENTELKKLSESMKIDRKSTRLNSSHSGESRMPSSA